MAKIGFEYIVAAELNMETETDAKNVKYTKGKEIGPGANVNITANSGDVKDHGDDRTLITDVSVTGGTISLELNEPTLEAEAWMLGHKYETEAGIVRNTEDVPPYLGIGFVGKSRSSKKTGTTYRAKIYLKTQFKEPGDSNATKQESVTFSHTTMEGSIFQLKNGDWNMDKEFETLKEAKSFIDKTLGITAGDV